MCRITGGTGVRDDRAVSSALAYVLNLTVATLLVSGLLLAGGNFFAGQQEQTIRTELRVVGQQLSGDLAAADRLVRSTSGSDTAVTLTRTLPSAVGRRAYSATLLPDDADSTEPCDSGGPGEPCLVLSTDRPDVTVTVALAADTPVSESTVNGGRVRIRYDDGTGALVIADA
jgi:hypothetical protein